MQALRAGCCSSICVLEVEVCRWRMLWAVGATDALARMGSQSSTLIVVRTMSAQVSQVTPASSSASQDTSNQISHTFAALISPFMVECVWHKASSHVSTY